MPVGSVACPFVFGDVARLHVMPTQHNVVRTVATEHDESIDAEVVEEANLVTTLPVRLVRIVVLATHELVSIAAHIVNSTSSST